MIESSLPALGLELADAVEAAVPGWVTRSVTGILEAFAAAGGELDPSVGGVPAVLARAAELGAQAAADAAQELRAMATNDVDAMGTTPLAVVRRAVTAPTTALAEAGVPPVVRDRFVSERFPDDVYDLTPGSLAAVDPELAELGVAWGAAKAAAHRARHGGPGSSR